MPPPVSARALATALHPLLPQTDDATRIALADILAGLAGGTIEPADARQRLNADPKLRAAYLALAGQAVEANGVPISFAGAQTGDVTIGPVAGGNIVTITLPPEDASRTSFWGRLTDHPVIAVLSLLATIATIAFGTISAGADWGGFTSQVGQLWGPSSTATPQPTPVETAGPGETLILVVPFEQTAGLLSTLPHREIAESLRKEAGALQLTTVKVVESTEVVAASDDEAIARLGDLHDAAIIVWGSETGARVRVRFFNRKQPDFEAAQVQIDETARSQLANPSANVEFVTRDLPSQIAFLTFFGLGQAAFSSAQYEEASTLLSAAVAQLEAVSVPPEGAAGAYFRLGWTQQRLVNLDASLDAYTRAIELNPDYLDAYNNRGIVYGDQGKLDLALADYNRALELNQNYAAVYNNRGIVYGDQGKLDLALADYNRALELNQNYAHAYNNRGIVYWYQGKLDLALADYNRALELDPNYADAYSNRGLVYRDQAKFDLALADYQRTFELNPNFANAYNNRGSVYWFQGRFDLALADYNRALELKPNFAEAYNNRGIVYRDQGKFDLAFADCSKAIELAPNYADAYNSRGVLYWYRREFDLALVDYTRTIELNPNNSDAYNNRGILYRDQGRFDLALADYNRALELNPNFASAYTNRGFIYETQGEPDLALADYTRSIELNPNYVYAYNYRARLYQAQSQRDFAIADFRRVIELAGEGSQLAQDAQARLAELNAAP